MGVLVQVEDSRCVVSKLRQLNSSQRPEMLIKKVLKAMSVVWRMVIHNRNTCKRLNAGDAEYFVINLTHLFVDNTEGFLFVLV